MNPSPKAKPDLSTESGRSPRCREIQALLRSDPGLDHTRSGGGLEPVGVGLQ